MHRREQCCHTRFRSRPLLPVFPRFRGICSAKSLSMPSASEPSTSMPMPGTDIVFACSHCATSFVVDGAAAGVTLQCQKCGKPTTVPKPTPETAGENSVRISDLQHQLKENESQRTEITSYI